MQIITDSKQYTESILNFNTNWKILKSSLLAETPAKLVKKLFQSPTLFATEVDTNILLKYAFVVEHASQSQFSILMEVLRNNTNFNDGILCLAGSGENFKGYRNRKWQSLPGNLHLSVFLNPNRTVRNFHTGFTILSAISVVQAIDAITGLKGKSAIKWVNDILINKAKVSGVLTQTQTLGDKVTGVFLGIGINVETIPTLEQDLFVPVATSLNDHALCNPAEVFSNLLKNISKNYKILLEDGYNQILSIYKERSIILGKEITVYSDPIEGLPHITAKGKVLEIGENLELYVEDFQEPITRGRITF